MKRFVTICLMLILVVSINPIGYAQTAAEIEFWQSVKGSDDIDMLKAYLQEYPEGKFKSLARLKIKQLGGTVTSPKIKKTEVKPSAVTIVAEKKWCGHSSSASEMSPQDCLDRDGIPVPKKSWADWLTNTYFGKIKKHKAFAISDSSWGVSAKTGNPALAKHLALHGCYIRSKKATSCRVVNLNGQHTEYSDYSKSSDPAFSAFGNIADVTGRYKIHLKGKSSEWEGILDVDANDSAIKGELKLCWGINSCALYGIKKIHDKGRGRYFDATIIRTKVLGAPRMPKEYKLLVSFSSDTSLTKGQVGTSIFEGKKFSHSE